MLLNVPDEFASSVKSLLLYAGPPREDEREGIEELKKSGGKVIFFLTPEDKKSYELRPDEAGVNWENDQLLQKWLMENMTLWTGGQVGACGPERAGQFAAVLSEVIHLTNFDNSSMQYLAKDNEPARNIYKNWRWVEDGIPLFRAKNLGKGNVAFIVAAGPSLDEQWDTLAKIQRSRPDTTFIVCGRSYTRAMEAGIVPDFVVEVEQFSWNYRLFLFAPKPHPSTVLCCPLTGCPDVLTAWPARKMILMDHNMAQFMKMTVGTDSIDGGNSILHHMFNLAMFLGCERTVLAGADLSYPPGAKDTHAVGTFPCWPGHVLVMEHNRQEPVEVPSTDGGKVQSSQPYKNFRLYLEMQIAANKKAKGNITIYNASPHGQLIAGTEFKDLSEWLTPSLPVLSSLEPRSSLGAYSSPRVSESTSSSSESTASA